ncbi:MAG: hypothetical protein WDO74_15800 [Pseudomonadota bacterium]
MRISGVSGAMIAPSRTKEIKAAQALGEKEPSNATTSPAFKPRA